MLQRLINLAAAAAVVLLSLEVATRILVGEHAGPQKVSAGALDHPFFGRIQKPDFESRTKALGKTFSYRSNNLGLRGRAMTIDKEPGVYRILFLGASVVDSGHLPEEETFVRLVDEMLNDRLAGDPSVEVVAVAQAGFTSYAALAQIANRVLELDPDLIIELDAADWAVSLHPEWDPSLDYLGRPRRRGSMSWSRWLASKSRLLNLLQSRSASTEPFDFDTHLEQVRQVRREAEFKDPPDALFERGIERFRSNLHRSALLCRDAGVVYALMTQLWLYKAEQPPEEDHALWLSHRSSNIRSGGWNLSPGVARRWVDAYNDVIRETAAEDGVLLIDQAKLVPNDLVHLIDDVHPTSAGSRAVAEIIVAELLRGGALPEAGAQARD